jgi:diketogulonate reductase-like aldo/keto reductase
MAPVTICHTEPAASTAISTVRLDDVDVVISPVGLGCASIMRLPSARQRRNLIAASIDAGLTHFDVARMYGLGAAEAELGRALRTRRNDVTVATKFGLDASGALRWLGRLQAPARAVLARSTKTRTAVRRQRDLFVAPRVYDAAKARASLDTSLRKLSMDHVDILFLHDPRPQDDIDGVALGAFLEEARTAGKIRGWGISLDDAANIGVLSRLPDRGIVQLRYEALDDSSVRPRSIAFGVLSAHAAISAWLSQSSAARLRWTTALGADPLQHDLLPKLLLAHTLVQPNVAAALYSTTQVPRLSAPAEVLRSGMPAAQLVAFSRCLADDRDAIVGLAAR